MAKTYTKEDREAVLNLIVQERGQFIEAVRSDLVGAAEKIDAAISAHLYADGIPPHVSMIRAMIVSFLAQTAPPIPVTDTTVSAS